MEKIVESFELYGKQYRLETGELAKQATGAVLVTQGETTVLVTAVVSKQERDYDFFPLTVDFIEKMYAVGRIPGGYLKREARPSDKGTLTARMIDRPIRPGFPDGFKQEVHIVATTLVVDSVNPPDTICVAGASAALLAGGAPFDGPAACVRIGRDVETGEFIVNPTFEESAHSDLELTIAGTADYISMVEAGADEISEEDMLAAMTFGQEAIAAFCEKQAAFLAKVNPEPLEYTIRCRRPLHRRARGALLRPHVGRLERCRQARPHGQGGGPEGRDQGNPVLRRGARRLGQRHRRRLQGAREEGHARHGHRHRRACRRPCGRRDPPAAHRAGLPAPRARLGPVPARPDPGAFRGDAGHAERMAAPRHHRPGRGQALHAPVQLPAVLHGRGRPHGRSEAPRRSATGRLRNARFCR